MVKAARWLTAALFAFSLAAVFGTHAFAQAQTGPTAAPTTHIEVNALPPAGVANFDPHKAVNAYLARVSGKDRARSDAYFEGGYVLIFVDTFYAVVLAGLLLWLRISARMRDAAIKATQFRLFGLRVFRFFRTPIYVAQYLAATTVATLPLSIYETFIREHAYGLSNQTFPQWAGDFGKSFLVTLIGFTLLLTAIYAAMRAVKRSWWVWATVITVVFLAIQSMIYPVYIAPLFNRYAPLPDSAMKSTILSLARANGIPADNVYTYDASRQTTRISANVSGFLGTTRISLSDNLLNDCTPSEVLAVMGHEMGHYVMDHMAILITWFGLLFLAGFVFVDWGFRRLAATFGGRWGVQGIDDPAGLPLLVALFSVFMMLATPVTNTIVRTQEIQADIFGLNAVRLPDAFATVVLKLSTYRKLSPGPWEEFVFFDHPSGRTRIWEAMRWKAEHINDPDVMAGPMSPQ
ncbi:MAG: M48 family metallopeptidase [Alphaproteobacteria bacterium]|nr:M48 family metallopeptidase [Alphaproteobacteria bacterium]MDE2111619.1 M48 family metallopeptidase [Alphaproteobacteria bacterium]